MTDTNSNTHLADASKTAITQIDSKTDTVESLDPSEAALALLPEAGIQTDHWPEMLRVPSQETGHKQDAAEQPDPEVPSSSESEDPAVSKTEGESQPDQAVQTDKKDPMLAGNRIKADLAIALMNREAQFFHTPENDPYAKIWMEDHFEVLSINSQKYELWVRCIYFLHTGTAIKKPDLVTAINQAKAQAMFAGPEIKVWLRVASHEGKNYIDLGNAKWEQVEITTDGWRVITLEESPVMFRRPESMRSLPHPEPNGDLRHIRDILNLKSESDLCLVLSWIAGAMNPTGPYPILIIQGEQGTGKSFMTKCIRSLLDPSTVPNRTLPRTERDLAISAESAWILCYDNVSGIKDPLSDAFCRISTGGGFGTRKLRTDKTEELFNSTRPMIFNGISDMIARHDFTDRSLVVTLQPIRAEDRKPETEIREAWGAVRSSLFGALCNVVMEGLRNYRHVHLDRSPRMADFAKWVVAAEPALPWEKGRFMAEFEKNRFELIEVALESDPIALSVLEMMKLKEGAKEWTGTPTALLKALAGYVPNNGANKKGWPQAPNIFSNRLRRGQTFLRAKGIDIEHSKSGNRNITIKMRPQGA